MVRLSSQLLMLNHESHIEVLQPRTLINTTKVLTSVLNRIAQIQVFVRLHQYLFLWPNLHAALRYAYKSSSNQIHQNNSICSYWLKFTNSASLHL